MIVLISIFLIYILTITFLSIGFYQLKDFKSTTKVSKTTFSIIIPFRNEAENLPKLIASISKLTYPKELCEFIFVDDDSTDNSVEILNGHFEQSQIIKNNRLSNSPKKDAITTAIQHANNEWIITTDADCLLPVKWLQTFDSYIQKNDCNMIVAPVTYKTNTSFFQQFQLLDFLSLQGATIGGFGIKYPFLCNGANLAYKKESFIAVNGFQNNDTIASGDDIFLFEKFLALSKKKVQYLKSEDVIVTTSPVTTIKNLIHQRVRWASKTSKYTLFLGKLIGLIVLLGNGLTALLPLFWATHFITFQTMLILMFLKLSIDTLLIYKTAKSYNQKINFQMYLLSGLLYPYFNVFVALKSLVSEYQWKGRSFKK